MQNTHGELKNKNTWKMEPDWPVYTCLVSWPTFGLSLSKSSLSVLSKLVVFFVVPQQS